MKDLSHPITLMPETKEARRLARQNPVPDLPPEAEAQLVSNVQFRGRLRAPCVVCRGGERMHNVLLITSGRLRIVGIYCDGCGTHGGDDLLKHI